MKKRFMKMFALMLCLIFMLSCTVFAADSPSTGDVVGSDSPSTGDVIGSDSPSTGDVIGSDSPSTGDVIGDNKPSTDNPSTGGSGNDASNVDTSNPGNSGTTEDEAQKLAEDYVKGVTAPKVVFNGVELEVTIKALPNSIVTAVSELAKEKISENAKVLKAFDVSLPKGDYSAGVDVTMNVPGILASQAKYVYVLHQKTDGTWEELNVVKVEDGAVTATFTSFSPVAIVLDLSSPRTGNQTPVVLFAIIGLAAVVAVAGIIRSTKLKTE